ncbi:MAG: hypothetical protein NT090_11185 [Acidobacteria bacterium]|nr:hypothetical protein [Acidobacteriota bacterium]
MSNTQQKKHKKKRPAQVSSYSFHPALLKSEKPGEIGRADRAHLPKNQENVRPSQPHARTVLLCPGNRQQCYGQKERQGHGRRDGIALEEMPVVHGDKDGVGKDLENEKKVQTKAEQSRAGVAGEEPGSPGGGVGQKLMGGKGGGKNDSGVHPGVVGGPQEKRMEEEERDRGAEVAKTTEGIRIHHSEYSVRPHQTFIRMK